MAFMREEEMDTETHKGYKQRRYSKKMKQEMVKLSKKVGTNIASEATR